ncbi:MAG: hypothetical protein A2X48_04460 [Lentisphaerae bacterium GWF2_49_21]|nr:MAG: hypothetical protein A2X48_04460 [Lentisphaerae bacterium GWF2_49_21]
MEINGIKTEILSDFYTFMLRLRMTQEALKDQYHVADEIRCPVHFCIGEEAAPTALSKVIGKEDYLFCDHRSHGFYFSKGGDINSLFGELYGRTTGCNGGIAGSQEICMPSVNFYSGAILSGMLAIAAGAALSFKYGGEGKVAVAVLGDGAIDEGITWETMNYASLMKLPVMFICENNGYSTYSPQLKRQPSDNITEKVEAFGVEGISMFGNDVVSLYRAFKKGIEHCRAGKGPYFIETYTYRWNSHVGPEDDTNVGYRTQDEINFWKNNCPIGLLEEKLQEQGLLTAEAKTAFKAEFKKEIESAFSFAKASPFPPAPDWNSLNLCADSPVADQYLVDIERDKFNFQQGETTPGPY